MSPRHLRHEIGQLLMAGFDGYQLPVELASLAREFSLGGLIFFRRNVEEPMQVAEVAWQARELEQPLQPWVAVDQEGGALQAPVHRVAADGDTRPKRRSGAGPALRGGAGCRAACGRRHAGLRAGAGHLHQREEHRHRRSRAGLGCRAGVFARRGHHDLPIVEHEAPRLREVEFAPFRAAIKADVASLMSAHVVVPAFGESQPATLSKTMINGILRDELGWKGLVFTDDMEMKAIAARMPVPEAAVKAIAAGCDVVLVCSGNHDLQVATLEAIIRAVEQDELPYPRVEEALAHQRAAKERFLGEAAGARRTPPNAALLRQVVGCEEHQLVAFDLARFA